MSEPGGRYNWVEKLARVSLLASVICAALYLLGAAAGLVWALLQHENWGLLPAAILAVTLITTLVGLLWLFVGFGLIQVIKSNETWVYRTHSRLERIESLMTSEDATLRELSDLARMSDAAKSMLYREREMEAFRAVIREELMRQDYAAAESLIEQIAGRSGYEGEAQRLREELQEARKATVEEKIAAALRRFENNLERHNWQQALREAARLTKIFPDNGKVKALPQRVKDAQAQVKRELLQQYGEAVRRNEIDRSIELLRKLDLYLTPQEGAALEESARGVFRAKLHNLGVQFAIQVTENNWRGAVETGEEIMREFPNTRMAEEVRGKIDVLRSKASGAPATGSAS